MFRLFKINSARAQVNAVQVSQHHRHPGFSTSSPFRLFKVTSPRTFKVNAIQAPSNHSCPGPFSSSLSRLNADSIQAPHRQSNPGPSILTQSKFLNVTAVQAPQRHHRLSISMSSLFCLFNVNTPQDLQQLPYVNSI